MFGVKFYPLKGQYWCLAHFEEIGFAGEYVGTCKAGVWWRLASRGGEYHLMAIRALW
jgi:hypothetical protein